MHVVMIIDAERLAHEGPMLDRVCNGLAKEEIEVSRIVPDDLSPEQAEQIESNVGFASQIETPMAVPPWMRRVRAERMVEELGSATPDVIHVIGQGAWKVGMDLAGAIDRPVALDVWSLGLARRVPRGRSAGRVGAYLVPTKPILKAVRQRRVDPDLVSLVPLGVNVPEQTRQVLADTNEEIAVAIIGSGRDVAAYRALLTGLARIVRDFPQLQICMELRGPHEHDIWRHAQRLELLGHISAIRDAAPHAALIAGCDILIIPERYGEIRSIVLEAMARGAAIIASEDPAFDALAGEETATIVREPSAVQWSTELRRLFAEPDRARALGQAGRELVMVKHRVQDQIAALAATFRKVLSGDAIAFAGTSA